MKAYKPATFWIHILLIASADAENLKQCKIKIINILLKMFLIKLKYHCVIIWQTNMYNF